MNFWEPNKKVTNSKYKSVGNAGYSRIRNTIPPKARLLYQILQVITVVKQVQ